MFKFFKKKKKEVQNIARSHEQFREELQLRKQKIEAFDKDRLIDEFEWHYVDEIQSLWYPTNRPFQIIGDAKVIENEFFVLKDKPFVCFVDRTNNTTYKEFLTQNILSITSSFKDKNLTFVNDITNLPDVNVGLLNYYFPFGDWKEKYIDLVESSYSSSIGNKILNFYGYKGPAQTGLLRIVENKLYFISLRENERIEDFFSSYFGILREWRPRKILYANSITVDGEIIDNEFDSETLKIVIEIKERLNRLKTTGQFFALAPALFKMIEDTSKSAPKISRMVIDKEYRILLPDYQNREIKLSHLTKSLYFLFLKHPNGVYCKDFKIYEEELLDIYKKVSYRLDIEQMRKSVSELSNPDGNAMRIHISRIKSAFAKEFSDFYASKYYVSGGGVARTILLDRTLLTWEGDV